jgi:Arrestin (or S-antigen), C-terminal domain
MSKCDLRIHLSKPDRTYAPGERIRGHVSVSADTAVRTKGLSVSLGWRTHGRGNKAEGPESKVQLYSGEWAAGEQSSYAFELVAPSGPASYHGTIVNVDHYLTARADLPWALDPKAETEILLVPPRGCPDYDFGPAYQAPAVALRGESTSVWLGTLLVGGCFGLPGLAIMAAGVAMGVSWLRGTSGSGGAYPALFLLPFGAVFAVVGFGIAALLQKRNMARRKLGDPLVNVEPSLARPGDRVSVQVTVQPRASVQLNGATAVFKGVEQAVSGSGSNRTTHTHELLQREVPLGAPPQLESGQMASFRASLELPKDAPYSFAATSNYVKWTVEIKFGIDGWPDWEREFPISVRP